VEQLLDYELQQGKNLLTGETWKIDLPKSNVLQFVLADGTRVSARPSGTEPKIKFYFSVNTALNNAADFKQTEKILDDKLDALAKEMGV
jgi:phosphoglucomutase